LRRGCRCHTSQRLVLSLNAEPSSSGPPGSSEERSFAMQKKVFRQRGPGFRGRFLTALILTLAAVMVVIALLGSFGGAAG
jgi:hypothetical protein